MEAMRIMALKFKLKTKEEIPAGLVNPLLTGVAQPAEELGRAPAQLLLERLGSPKAESGE